MTPEEFDDEVINLVNDFEGRRGEEFDSFFMIAINENSHLVYMGGEGEDIIKMIGILDLAKARLLNSLAPAIHFEGSLQ